MGKTALIINVAFTVALTIASGWIVNKITEKFSWTMFAALAVIAVSLGAVAWFEKRAQSQPTTPPVGGVAGGRFENISISGSPFTAVGERNNVQIGTSNAAASGDGGTAIVGKRNKVVHRGGWLAAVTSLLVATVVVVGVWLHDRNGSGTSIRETLRSTTAPAEVFVPSTAQGS